MLFIYVLICGGWGCVLVCDVFVDLLFLEVVNWCFKGSIDDYVILVLICSLLLVKGLFLDG